MEFGSEAKVLSFDQRLEWCRPRFKYEGSQGQGCFTGFCLGRGRVLQAGQLWRVGGKATGQCRISGTAGTQRNHGIKRSGSARVRVLGLSVGAAIGPGNSDPKTAGYKSSAHGMLWASKVEAQWKKKKKRFDFVYYPDSISGFLEIVRGLCQVMVGIVKLKLLLSWQVLWPGKDAHPCQITELPNWPSSGRLDQYIVSHLKCDLSSLRAH